MDSSNILIYSDVNQSQQAMIAISFEKNYKECCVPGNVVSDKLVKLEGREFFFFKALSTPSVLVQYDLSTKALRLSFSL